MDEIAARENGPTFSLENRLQRAQLLARMRCVRARLRVLTFEVDELGIFLKNDWISVEEARAWLVLFDTLPVYAASVMLNDEDETDERDA